MVKHKPFIFLIVTLVLLIAVAWISRGTFLRIAQEPIKVGILHSFSGTMAISEKAVAESTLMAIDEINAQGGLLERKIQAIVVDGKSDWPTFAAEAENLITKQGVSAIFGCWTSACRKSLKPVVEKYNSLLIYPLQYEGLEMSPHILYLGAAPNQQIIPAIKWASENFGKRLFLVGSDYIFPRTANEIIKEQVKNLKGEIVGEEYITLGSSDVKDVIAAIKKNPPDVIINTINGDTNKAFFAALHQDKAIEDIPVLSFSISENEIPAIGIANLEGKYAAWNYFQSIQRPENRLFVKNFQRRYGQERVTSDPMEAAYFGVYLWAQAVEKAGTPDPQMVIDTLKMQSFDAPEGVVSVDRQTMHTWKIMRIGRVQADGQFEIVWDSIYPIRPVPYPASRSIRDWNQFLMHLYQQWGQQWGKASEIKDQRIKANEKHTQ